MLLDDIIAILADQNGSLEAALLKTKILLRQLGHKELVTWVNSELAGYPDKVDVPDYRVVASQPHGQLASWNWQVADWVLPTGQLTETQRKAIRETRISSSIGSIEKQVEAYRKNKQGLIRQLPPEFIPEFQKALEKGVNVISMWCTINMADVEGIVIQVRSRLLDFCLELQEALGGATEPQDVQQKAAAIDTPGMFHTIVYGGTVIIGNNIQVNNKKGDIDGLLSEIAKLGFDKGELEELRKAVEHDKKPDITEGQTSSWYLKAMKKAGKGALDVGVEVVSKVVVESIKKYIGF